VAPGSQLIRLALFGQPVAHSLSPRIHALFAQQCGLLVDYRAIEASEATLPREIDMLAAHGGRGCNITVPLKHAAWRLATHSSERARRAMAANTLVFESSGGRFAENTDGEGLVSDLENRLDTPLAGRSICLLGAGGAAAGVLGALLSRSPRQLVIANRTVRRATELAASHRDLGGVLACSLDELGVHGTFDLLINATSQGHSGEAAALSPRWLASKALCYDLNYGAAAEPLRRYCSFAGLRYADGLGMLVGQAALAFELWTGVSPDAAPVLQELRAEA